MRLKNVFDREGAKRRKLAARALADMRRLAAAKFPLPMLFDKMTGNVERLAGESWPEAFGRTLGGISLPQLRDYLCASIEQGYYRPLELIEKTPSASELTNFFRGVAVLLIATEVEIASATASQSSLAGSGAR